MSVLPTIGHVAHADLYHCSPDPMSYGARPAEGGGNNLNFDEDVNDIPSNLVFDEVSRKVLLPTPVL